MGVSSITVVSPADNTIFPDTVDGILRPHFNISWVNNGAGGGPYDVLHEWDTDSGFPTPIQDSNLGIAGLTDEGVPPSDMGPEGTTWFYRVKVTDTADAGNLTSATRTHTWKNYNAGTNVLRHLYLLTNLGPNFGDLKAYPRFLYVPANIGVNFIAGVDGNPKDNPRFLYQLANLVDDTPTPHIWSIAPVIQKTGLSVTITGKGLGTTQATFVSEVRLYDSPGTGGSFVTGSIVSWADDEITFTIPGGAATTSYVTVVHTTPTPDLFSNQKLLTITLVDPDPLAGWWANIANLRNATDTIKPLPNIPGMSANYSMIDQDVGNGVLTLHADHPDLATIIDPANDVSSLVKLFENGRYAYSFYAERLSRPYMDDGALKVDISGDGLESCLRWGRALPYDHPNNPSKFPNWVWGSSANLLDNPNMDDNTANAIENPSGADGNNEQGDAIGWSERGGATVKAINDPIEAFTGSWYLQITPSGHHSGGQQTFKVEPNKIYRFVARVKEPTAAGMRITMAVSGQDQGATNTGAFANLFSYNGEWLCELGNVARNPAGNGCPGGSSDGTWQSLSIEIQTGSQQEEVTVTVQGDHHPGCGGPGNLVFRLGELVATGFGVGLDPWEPADPAKHAAGSFQIDTTRSISGKQTVVIDPTGSLAGIKQTVQVVEGGRYTVGIQAFNEGTPAVNDNWRLLVQQLDGTEIAGVTKVPAGSSAVDKWEVSYSVPSGIEEVIYLFRYIGPNNPGPLYATLAQFAPGDPAATPGKIILDILTKMQARNPGGGPGALEFLQTSFTATTDSNGVPWTSTIALEIRPNDSLLEVVQRIQATGFEWEVVPQNYRAGGDSGVELAFYNDLGKGTNFESDREGPVILPSESAITGSVTKAAQKVNFVYVQGAEGIWSSADAGVTNMTALERREEWIVNEQTLDTTTTGQVAGARLDEHNLRELAFSLNIPLNDIIRPNLDFLNSDTLRVFLPGVVPDGYYRVKGITGSLTGEGVTIQHTIDFNRIEWEEEAARDRAIKRMLELLGAENLSPGTGLVSTLPATSSGGGGGSPTGQATQAHTHSTKDLKNRGLSGDVSGSIPGPLTVKGVQGRQVASDAPVGEDMLIWNADLGRWEPVSSIKYARLFLFGG